MSVVVRLKSGAEFPVDRRYSANEIQRQVIAAQQARKPLLELQDDRTPSRVFYIDPSEVEAVSPGRYD